MTENNPQDIGFIVLDKPEGMSSQALVLRVKKSLKIRKAGHTGTLDPLATGVLPVALGEATKVIPYLDENLKIYSVEGKLGEATRTYDSEGEVSQTGCFSNVTEQDLKDALLKFCGEILQTPPAFSAIKVKGKPLYVYARKGKSVEIPKRRIIVSKIVLISFKLPFFRLVIHCSRGTYIRSIIHDLGEALGCFAHVTGLRRLQTGPFDEGQAVSLDSLQENPNQIKKSVRSIEDCLNGLPALNLISKEELQEASSGGCLNRIQKNIEEQGLEDKTVVLKYEDKVIALVHGARHGKIKYRRVLNRF